jgi:hypothetical protein
MSFSPENFLRQGESGRDLCGDRLATDFASLIV